MSNTFFTKEVVEDYSYLLLSVRYKGCNNCGSYFKGTDGQYIVSVSTGEKFYSLREFVLSIKGYIMEEDEWKECRYYDEDAKYWFPLHYII